MASSNIIAQNTTLWASGLGFILVTCLMISSVATAFAPKTCLALPSCTTHEALTRNRLFKQGQKQQEGNTILRRMSATDVTAKDDDDEESRMLSFASRLNIGTYSQETPSRRERRRYKKDRYEWLLRATDSLLDTEPGKLNRGKWHEIPSIMNGWLGLRYQPSVTPMVMERLLKRLMDERQAGNKEAKATAFDYNAVISSWLGVSSRSSKEGRLAARRARDILLSLQRTYEATQDLDYQPNNRSFLLVLHALSKAGDASGSRTMLKWMHSLYQSGKNRQAKPNEKAYGHVLHSIAVGGHDNAGKEAEDMLKSMNETGVSPNAFHYTATIKAWVASQGKGRTGAEHAERILEEMRSASCPVSPDAVTYSTVIKAWADSGMKHHAADRAEVILRRMEGDGLVDEIAYSCCMSAWVRAGVGVRSMERVERLFEKVENPGLGTYNHYIHALGKNCQVPGSPQRALALLIQLERDSASGKIDFAPDLFTYNLVIEAWANSGIAEQAAAASLAVLNRLLDSERLIPNRLSFSFVLTAIAKCTLPGYARKGERLLEFMKDMASRGADLEPTFLDHMAVLLAHARSNDPGSAQAAEDMLNQLELLAPTNDGRGPKVGIYNAVIDAWSRSGQGTLAARKAEAVLDRLQQQYELQGNKPELKPSIDSYNGVVMAWARSGTKCCARKAEKYLQHMWRLYRMGEMEKQPNTFTYNIVIEAVSRTKSKDKAQRALRWLRQLDKLYEAGVAEQRPTRIVYNAVLLSCALEDDDDDDVVASRRGKEDVSNDEDPDELFTQEKRRTLDTAMSLLQEIQGASHVQPDHVTYGAFLKACATLLPYEHDMRRNVVLPVFRQACKDGLVDGEVLLNLRNAATPDLLEELLAGVVEEADVGVEHLTPEHLPREWRCNVVSRRASGVGRRKRRGKRTYRTDRASALRRNRRHDGGREGSRQELMP